MKKTYRLIAAFIILAMATSGCSVFMAASRSSYRGDISVLKEGAKRPDVITEIGEPDSFNRTDSGDYEDRYTIDPEAHRTWVKIVTAFFHLGADLVTAFLWELVGTPYEIAVRDRVATYQLVYSQEGILKTITKSK